MIDWELKNDLETKKTELEAKKTELETKENELRKNKSDYDTSNKRLIQKEKEVKGIFI